MALILKKKILKMINLDGIIFKDLEEERKVEQYFKNEYKKNFNIAMDDEFKIGQRGHFPVHKHIHIAEAFERSLHDKN